MNAFKHLLASALIATSAASFAQTSVTIITTESTAAKSDSTVVDSTVTSSTVGTPTTVVISKSTTRPIERIVSDFAIYVGFNNLGGNLPVGYELRPLGSRFVALAWQKRIPLIASGPTKLRLITGPEVAWNNFMFEGRNVLTEQNGQLIVKQADTGLRKTKLVTTQLNLPMMLSVSTRSGFSISAGAYVGMRLDSYTKVKPEGGSAVRSHNSFNLNPVRWGFMTEIGFRGCGKLFGRYEPNSLFRSGQGPDAAVWSVGIKL
ncbi:outer membrane beta-barrel protein [Spirosoma rhododendri]|uniref:PorT family protein n=1 Tax=Spirosoma rhododendri TaxID=2728024 RepID=A0A7L5DMY4_9BACT|nr:outer membrane beta-barrel protein [Spirosoma rhododendri]QJD77120.1 PorT family protein [Spirosoma rhododendri]